jgi:hypothetical protein
VFYALNFVYFVLHYLFASQVRFRRHLPATLDIVILEARKIWFLTQT